MHFINPLGWKVLFHVAWNGFYPIADFTIICRALSVIFKQVRGDIISELFKRSWPYRKFFGEKSVSDESTKIIDQSLRQGATVKVDFRGNNITSISISPPRRNRRKRV